MDSEISRRIFRYSSVWTNASRAARVGYAFATNPSIGSKRKLERSAQLSASRAACSASLSSCFVAFIESWLLLRRDQFDHRVGKLQIHRLLIEESAKLPH